MTSNSVPDKAPAQSPTTGNLSVDSITDAGALVVVAVAPGVEGESWSVDRTVELAREWADGPTGLQVVDLSLDGIGLDMSLGVTVEEGVTDVVFFGASVGRVAHLPEDTGFRFIGSGTATGRASELLTHPRWNRFLLRLRAGGRRALVYLPARLTGSGALMEEASTVVLLGKNRDDVAPFIREGDSALIELMEPGVGSTTETGSTEFDESSATGPSEGGSVETRRSESESSESDASGTESPDGNEGPGGPDTREAKEANQAAAAGIGAGLLATDSRPKAPVRTRSNRGAVVLAAAAAVFVISTLVLASGLAPVPAFAPEFVRSWIGWVAGLFGWTPVLLSAVRATPTLSA